MTPAAKVCRNSVASIKRNKGLAFSASLANKARVALKALSVMVEGSQRNSRIFSDWWRTIAPQGFRTRSTATFWSPGHADDSDILHCSRQLYSVSIIFRKGKLTES